MLRLCENASSSGLFCHQFVALPVLDDDWSPYDTAPGRPGIPGAGHGGTDRRICDRDRQLAGAAEKNNGSAVKSSRLLVVQRELYQCRHADQSVLWPVGRKLPANVLSEGLAVSSAKKYSFFVRN